VGEKPGATGKAPASNRCRGGSAPGAGRTGGREAAAAVPVAVAHGVDGATTRRGGGDGTGSAGAADLRRRGRVAAADAGGPGRRAQPDGNLRPTGTNRASGVRPLRAA